MLVGIKYTYNGLIVETVHSFAHSNEVAVKHEGAEDKNCISVKWADLVKIPVRVESEGLS